MRHRSTMLVGAFLMTACSSDPTTRSAEEGAGVGAVAGGVICAAAHMNSSQCAAMIAGGAAVGATVAYSLAKDIEKRQKELAGKENNLDARLNQVQQANASMVTFNSQLNTQVQEAQAKISKARGSQAQAQKTANELDQQIKEADAQLNAADRELEGLKQFKAQRKGPPSPTLDAEIARYEKLLQEARSDTQALAQVRYSL